MKNINNKKGFTIIEVVLVLAIAGLIFLMVFVALPSLQRSQRDTQRRQDYANLLAAVESYITNHGGKLPTANSIAGTMINSEGKDPSGNPYTVTVQDGSTNDGLATTAAVINLVTSNAGNSTVAAGTTVLVITHANCGTNGATPTATAPTDRHFLVYGVMEDGQVYCQAQ